LVTLVELQVHLMNKKQILFIGCGNMGNAILSSLVQNCTDVQFSVIDGNFKNPYNNVTTYKDVDALNFIPDAIFIGVKPQILSQIKDDLAKIITKHNIVISMLAGTSTEQIAAITGTGRKIARVMPNIAAMKGNSTSSCYFNENMSEDDKDFAITLFKHFGICEVLSDEEDMHISTLINGGAIAYFALIIKYFKQAAVKNAKNLTEEQINNLLYNTYKNLLEVNKPEDEIISLICSKKGTTEAVIESLKKQSLEQLISKAIEDGMIRSKELGKNNE
jgi:pyrroline-5-carboxylate reductase